MFGMGRCKCAELLWHRNTLGAPLFWHLLAGYTNHEADLPAAAKLNVRMQWFDWE